MKIKKIIKITLILAPVAVLVGLVISLPFIIKIKSIQCATSYGPCSDYLSEKLNNLSNISLRKAKVGADKILKGEIKVKDYSINYNIPSTLVINVVEYKPMFIINSLQDSRNYQVSKEGLVLGITESSSLPKMSINSFVLSVGENISSEMLFALKILADVSQVFVIEKALFESEGLAIRLGDNTNVIFPLEGDRQLLVGSLVLIKGELNEDRDISLIDLRYRNPILK